MWIYNGLPLIQTLYLALFARYSASKISVDDLDLSESPKVNFFNFVGKPICDFIMILCWYKLSISYHLRDIPHLKFGKWRWPFRVTEGQIFHLFWEANMGFHNGLLLIRTLSRVPFARYSASKISVSDLDLSGSPKFKYFIFSGKPIWDFIMTFCWYELSIAYRLRDIPHQRFRLVTLTF